MVNKFMEASVQFKEVHHHTIRQELQLKKPICVSLQKLGRTIFWGHIRCDIIEVYS